MEKNVKTTETANSTEKSSNFSKTAKPFVKKNKKKINKKKPCDLCLGGVNYVDYKDVELLSKYLNYNNKILPRRVTGLCQKHQRMIENGIKRARIVALLPFIK